jgi:hypothetical protein
VKTAKKDAAKAARAAAEKAAAKKLKLERAVRAAEKKARSDAKELRKKLEKKAAKLAEKAAEDAKKAEKKARKKLAEKAEEAAKAAKKARKKAAEKNTATMNDVAGGSEVLLSPATETVHVAPVDPVRTLRPKSKNDLPSTVPVVVEAALSPATSSPEVKAAAEAAMKPSESWTVVALRARARQLGLVGYSSLTKAQLLERLRD